MLVACVKAEHMDGMRGFIMKKASWFSGVCDIDFEQAEAKLLFIHEGQRDVTEPVRDRNSTVQPES